MNKLWVFERAATPPIHQLPCIMGIILIFQEERVRVRVKGSENAREKGCCPRTQESKLVSFVSRTNLRRGACCFHETTGAHLCWPVGNERMVATSKHSKENEGAPKPTHALAHQPQIRKRRSTLQDRHPPWHLPGFPGSSALR